MAKLPLRFFTLYFLLTISPWYYLYPIPGMSYVTEVVYQAEKGVVEFTNAHVLHVKEVLNANGGGSGDTSYAWAQFYTYLLLALVGSLAWTLIDKKKDRTQEKLGYGLRTLVRYYLAIHAFGYGIIKLFALQMYFPNLSQLATPLGDFLPMRLSWMFMGYSTSYQQFAGLMEVVVGILLMYRGTVTLGALVGAGVFANVLVMNLSYDIPVKLFSGQLTLCAVFLLVSDWKRLVPFLVGNLPAGRSDLYDLSLNSRWTKIGRLAFKALFVFYFALMPFYQSMNRFEEESNRKEQLPIRVGVYEIKAMTRNKDTVEVSTGDWAWKDFIFDYNGSGSVNTVDTLFRQRYRRGYFAYQRDSAASTITFRKFSSDTAYLFQLRYNAIDDSTLALTGRIREDSLHFLLGRKRRHFQLAERQFHWISESNR